MTKPVLYVKDKVYIPVKHVDVENLRDKYTVKIYDEQACKACEYRPERHCSICDTCVSFKASYKLFKERDIKGKGYIGLPLGDKADIERIAGIYYRDYKIVDKRVSRPFDYKIKLTVNLYDYQDAIIEKFRKKFYGLIEAPPRTGKTLIALALCIEAGQRCVLIADQHEFLDQFIWHIEGNEVEGIPKCTNLPEIEKKVGRKLYGIPKTEEDFETYQIMAMTYQSLAHAKSGNARLKKLLDNVGLIWVDEVHSSGAPVFSSVLNKCYSLYRFGVTGTVERKDGKHKIVKRVMGPVVAKTSREALTPKVFLSETGLKYSRVPKHFTFAMQRLAKNDKRNEMIIDRAVKDIKKGHSLVIPVMFKTHAKVLIDGINKKMGTKVAEPFFGGGGAKNKEARKAVLRRAKEGTTKAVVGIRKLLQRGLNVPRWSLIFEVMPISNKPNLKQETKRVCTPMDGKRTPVVRLMFDAGMGISVGCAKSSVRHMVELGYDISDDAKTLKCLEMLDTRGSKNDEKENLFW